MERQQSFGSQDGNAPATMFPTLYSHSRRKNRTVANAMENNNWITDLVHSLSALNCHDQDEELVEAAGFSGHDQDEDEITWARTSDGLYSARSAYTLQFEGSLMTSFPTLVWRIWRLQSANPSCGSSCNAGYGLPTGFNEGSGQISIFAHFVAVTWRRRNTFLRTPFFSTITVRSLLEHEEYVRVRDVIPTPDRDRISGSARFETRPDRGRLPLMAVGPLSRSAI
jgi:hypothetical protein